MPEGSNIEIGRSDPALAQRARRRRRRRFLLLVVVPLLVVVVAVALYLSGGRYVVTDNAYVRADKVTISTDVSGMVAAVLVAENQVVAAGQPLFRLNPSPRARRSKRLRNSLATSCSRKPRWRSNSLLSRSSRSEG